MANQYLARLGILLSVDSAELSKGFNEAAKETKNFNRQVESESKKAIAEINRMRDAIEDYGKEVTMVTKIEREFRDGGRYANLAKNEAVRQSILKEAAAVDALVASQKKANAAQGMGGGAGKLSTYQMQALSYQTTDIITSLAGGQNPMLVLLQQGGQLRDQFGGLKNVFEAFKSVLTPLRVSLLGVGSVVGVLAYAFYKGDEEAKKFRDTLVLTGNMAGVTADSFKGLANIVSNSMNIGVRDAKDIFNELISTGRFTTASMIPVAEVIAKISKLTGQTAEEVSKSLIPSFDGSASSAKKLNEQYNFLTVTQYRHIEALEQQNKKQEAIAYTANLLKERLEKERRELGYLEIAISSVTKAWQEFKDELFAFGREKTTGEKIAVIAKQMSDNMALAANSPALKESLDKRNAVLLEKYKELAAQLDKEQDTANKKSQENDANQAAIRQQNLVTQQNLEFELRQKYIDDSVAQAEVGENKIASVRIETAKKMAAAALKFEKENLQSGGANYSQKLALLEQEYNSIRNEGIKKEAEISRQEAKKFADRQANEQLTIDKEKEKLDLYSKNIFLSDKDLQIAMDRLQMEKNIAEILRSEMSMEDKDKYIAIEKGIEAQKEAVASLGERLKMIKDIHASVFSSMANAVDTFVKTGKFAFKDFTKSVILNILSIAAQAQMLKMLSGVGGIFSNIFSGGANATGLASLPSSVNTSFTPRASGGAVAGNSPYLVGESGMELFVPNTSGTIIPNGQFNNAMGGTTINYNAPYIENMSAIDTQSFSQALAKNKNAVWAANQSANRSMPASR